MPSSGSNRITGESTPRRPRLKARGENRAPGTLVCSRIVNRPLPSLSVVVPVRNEADNIEPLARELTAALACLDQWECIWVDDASTDATREHLRRVASEDPRHRILVFGEHRGQTAALLAGWRAAGGEFVGGLDGDRQNDPADLPRLLGLAVEHGLDMVNGVRAARRDTLARRISSRIANGFRNWITGDSTTDVGCSTRVLRRSLVEEIPAFRGMHRFLPMFVRRAGGRVGEAPVGHRPRAAGRSNYGIMDRLWIGLADCLAVRWMASRRIRLDAIEDEAASSDDARRRSAAGGRRQE